MIDTPIEEIIATLRSIVGLQYIFGDAKVKEVRKFAENIVSQKRGIWDGDPYIQIAQLMNGHLSEWAVYHIITENLSVDYCSKPDTTVYNGMVTWKQDMRIGINSRILKLHIKSYEKSSPYGEGYTIQNQRNKLPHSPTLPIRYDPNTDNYTENDIFIGCMSNARRKDITSPLMVSITIKRVEPWEKVIKKAMGKTGFITGVDKESLRGQKRFYRPEMNESDVEGYEDN